MQAAAGTQVKSAERVEFARLWQSKDYRAARELADAGERAGIDRLAWRHNRAMCLWAEGRNVEARHLYTTGAHLLDTSDDHELKGNFHNGFALVLQDCGETDTALIEYEASRFHYGLAGADGYAADVENNIAFLLMSLGRLPEAAEAAGRAVALHLKAGGGNLAEALNTQEQIIAAIKAVTR